MPVLHVCGDCKADLLGIGAVVDPETKEIGLGVECELRGRKQATSGVVVHDVEVVRAHFRDKTLASARSEEEARSLLRGLEADSPGMQAHHVAPPGDPIAIGPVTEVATRLLCAWSTANGGECEPITIARAVDVARELFRLTQGR